MYKWYELAKTSKTGLHDTTGKNVDKLAHIIVIVLQYLSHAWEYRSELRLKGLDYDFIYKWRVPWCVVNDRNRELLDIVNSILMFVSVTKV